MSKFKVGDRVRIREDLSTEDKVYGYILHEEMFKYKGQEAIIKKIWDGYYTIDIDNREWAWTEEMFESKDLHKIKELEQRIEKLEKCVMGEQKSLEKRENEPLYERNERFAKILKKELERNEIILNEPKPSLLTEDERVILRILYKKWKWIARNGIGWLFVHSSKPKKERGVWCSNDADENLIIFNHLFKFIQWDDNEPYNIEELLKGENGNE